MSSSYYYIDDDNIERGPFSESEISTWWRYDLLPKRLLIKGNKQAKWQYAEEILNPTSSCTSSPVCSSLVWYYEDDEGIERGPFQTKQMRDWIDQGYFDGSTKIRKAEDSEFSPLSAHPHQKILLSTSWLIDYFTFTYGPFSTAQMRIWFSKGFFSSPNVLIRSFYQSKEESRHIEDFSMDEIPAFVHVNLSTCSYFYLRHLNEYWRYLDLQGNIRGPYSTNQMRHWMSNGLLASDIAVQRIDPRTGKSLTEFRPANKYYCSIGDQQPSKYWTEEGD
jgi:hypothetical protein